MHARGTWSPSRMAAVGPLTATESLFKVSPMRTRTIVRDRRLQLAVTEAEQEKAVDLARARGVTISELVRDLLRSAHQQHAGGASR